MAVFNVLFLCTGNSARINLFLCPSVEKLDRLAIKQQLEEIGATLSR